MILSLLFFSDTTGMGDLSGRGERGGPAPAGSRSGGPHPITSKNCANTRIFCDKLLFCRKTQNFSMYFCTSAIKNIGIILDVLLHILKNIRKFSKKCCIQRNIAQHIRQKGTAGGERPPYLAREGYRWGSWSGRSNPYFFILRHRVDRSMWSRAAAWLR